MNRYLVHCVITHTSDDPETKHYPRPPEKRDLILYAGSPKAATKMARDYLSDVEKKIAFHLSPPEKVGFTRDGVLRFPGGAEKDPIFAMMDDDRKAPGA
jgi:hypothetical protein